MQGRTDRGASTLELALLTPVLLLVILFVVQFAMVFHARHVALAAAQSAARSAREQRGGANWQGVARTEVYDYVQKIGPQLLTIDSVIPDQKGNERSITVTGTAVRVVPFLTFTVKERSGGPIECYRPDIGAGTNCGNQGP